MGEQKRLLLIFSDAELLQLLERTILADHQAISASTAEAAKTAFSASRPDLVILGDDLPEGASLELANYLFERQPTLPIILLTGPDTDFAPQQVVRLGFVDWLTTPIIADAVKAAVQRGLDRNALWQKWLHLEANRITGPLQERVNELEAIFKVGRTINAKLTLDEVLSEVVDAAVQVTEAEQGSILLLDEETDELYMRAARNFQEDLVRTFRIPVDDTYAGQVIQSGKPVFLEAQDPQKIKTAYLVYSLAYVPLIYHDRTIGVLGVDNAESGKSFDDKDIQLLSTMADYAAIAIENARLFAQTELEQYKLETIVTQIEEGIIVLADDGTVLMVNPVIAKAFQIDPQATIGKKYQEVFSNRDLLMALSGEAPDPNRIEIKIDSDAFFRAQITQVKGLGTLVSLHDISYLKQLDRLKTEFVTAVSHDLRTPLTSILGYVALIERAGEVNEQQADFIRRVQISVNNITTLITEVLNWGKIEGRLDENFEEISTLPLLKTVITDHQPLITARDQHLTTNLPKDLPSIFADPIQLRQMFENLLGNAIKYTQEGGAINVNAETEKDQLIIRFADTGRGIPVEDQNKIFDRFYRAINASEDTPGTGLGLAITKSVVENHRGRIWVDSQVGQGSTFTVVLPIDTP